MLVLVLPVLVLVLLVLVLLPVLVLVLVPVLVLVLSHPMPRGREEEPWPSTPNKRAPGEASTLSRPSHRILAHRPRLQLYRDGASLRALRGAEQCTSSLRLLNPPYR